MRRMMKKLMAVALAATLAVSVVPMKADAVWVDLNLSGKKVAKTDGYYKVGEYLTDAELLNLSKKKPTVNVWIHDMGSAKISKVSVDDDAVSVASWNSHGVEGTRTAVSKGKNGSGSDNYANVTLKKRALGDSVVTIKCNNKKSIKVRYFIGEYKKPVSSIKFGGYAANVAGFARAKRTVDRRNVILKAPTKKKNYIEINSASKWKVANMELLLGADVKETRTIAKLDITKNPKKKAQMYVGSLKPYTNYTLKMTFVNDKTKGTVDLTYTMVQPLPKKPTGK